MSVPSGTKLGVFEVSTLLGVGGMGEVYRARDTKLGREVAIKILPAEFANDRDRLARFGREARLLAALNHPNIAHIHDLQESDAVQFLVMELVVGTTLADRLKKGPLSVNEALKLFSQIAEGLDAAHQQGVIHRDLKPANIKVTDDGKVSVLDFGLAKAMEPASLSDREAVTSPWNTQSDGKSREGQILGTPAYMSPEQARGKPVDKRTDIWAFGCCLYETLTGKRPFGGATGSDTLAAILKSEPDWEELPNGTPVRLRELLQSCLAKDPRDRLRDIGDARNELTRVAADPIDAKSARALASRSIRRWRFATAGMVFVAIGLTAAAWTLVWSARQSNRPDRQTGDVVVLSMTLPLESALATPSMGTTGTHRESQYALSPDGSRLVYVGGTAAQTKLYLRPMSQSESVVLPGTDGAASPFFSPDGQSVGFSARGKLKRLRIGESRPVDLADVRTLRGASWGRDHMIYFADSATGSGSPINDGLKRISDIGGGKPESITKNVDHTLVTAHAYPCILPDGKSLLFSLVAPSGSGQDVAVLSLKTGEWKPLVSNASSPQYVPTGHLLFYYRGWNYAVRFDLDRLEISGPRVAIVQSTFRPALSETGYFVHGPLVIYDYADGRLPDRSLAWINRRGESERLTQSARPWTQMRIAPDGRHLAAEIAHDRGFDVWIYDLVSDTHSRLTFSNSNMNPVWTRDANRVIYTLRDGADYFLISAPIDGSSQPQRFHKSRRGVFPMSVHRDQHTLAYVQRGISTSWDVYAVSIDGGDTSKPLLDTEFNEEFPAFSPDGRWLAYTSDETGQQEIFVRPYPLTTAKYQISEHGGTKPLWSEKGDELFYRSETLLWSVPIKAEPAFEKGQHQLLLDKPFVNWPSRFVDYSVSPDGERFLFIELNEAEVNRGSLQHLTVVQNWFEELERLVPAEGSK